MSAGATKCRVPRIGQVRRDVARISTVLREREIEAAEQLAADERSGGNV